MIDLTCVHHERHETRTVHVVLDGQPAVPDYPPIPHRLALEFNIDVWDAAQYRDMHGYCTGDDAVSRAIIDQGIWEGHETLLALDILNRTAGTVVDIGCQVGWYSVLATLTGHRVEAFDGDRECCPLAAWNAHSPGAQTDHRPIVQVRHVTFSDDTPQTFDAGPVAFFKADIEGQEMAAVQAFRETFRLGQVEYAAIELTPVWGLERSVAVVEQMSDWGYACHAIPDKGYERLAELAADPLGETLDWGLVTDPRAWLESVDQVNALFARPT